MSDKILVFDHASGEVLAQIRDGELEVTAPGAETVEDAMRHAVLMSAAQDPDGPPICKACEFEGQSVCPMNPEKCANDLIDDFGIREAYGTLPIIYGLSHPFSPLRL